VATITAPTSSATIQIMWLTVLLTGDNIFREFIRGTRSSSSVCGLCIGGGRQSSCVSLICSFSAVQTRGGFLTWVGSANQPPRLFAPPRGRGGLQGAAGLPDTELWLPSTIRNALYRRHLKDRV
jgi:hypothetical protein